MRPFLRLTLAAILPVAMSAFQGGVSFLQKHTNRHYQRPIASTTTTALHATTENTKQYKHALAILAMPYTSMDRIANEAILETVLPTTRKLSVVLRCEGARSPQMATLRRYVGEIYSQLWDCALAADTTDETEQINPDLPDVVVYPQNLPNLPPESWIDIAPDLDAVCSHDFITGWTSESMGSGIGKRYEGMSGNGVGGLEEHVAALNSERRQRNLSPVTALHVTTGLYPNSIVLDDDQIVFLDDDDDEEKPNKEENNDSAAGFWPVLDHRPRKICTIRFVSVVPLMVCILDIASY